MIKWHREKIGKFSEIIITSNGFWVYWYNEIEQINPIFEFSTTSPAIALKYFKMGEENKRA